MLDKNAKGLIFDIDGTLVDSMPVHLKACQITCQKRGFDFPEDLLYRAAGMPTEKVFNLLIDQLGLDFDGEELAKEKDDIYMRLGHEIKPIQPVVDIVFNMSGVVPMSLGTGANRAMAELNIASIGLDKHFDILVCAEDVSNHKPFPDTFLKCAELMDVAPEFCQVFEDGDLGLQAATKAGMISTDIRLYLE